MAGYQGNGARQDRTRPLDAVKLQVYLWSMPSTANPTWFARNDIALSGVEAARANAYRFDKDRQQFVAARRFLRYVLGQHLQLEPHTVQIREAPGSKPTVETSTGCSGIYFSLSRSAGDVLIGVTSHREIGIDVETVRPLPDVDGLAPHVFSSAELGRWNKTPANERLSLFFQAWTRKEALGKAMGIGIGNGPRSIEVSLATTPVDRWSPTSQADNASGWLMSPVDVGAETLAYVVVEQLNADEGHCDFQDTHVAGGNAVSFNGHSAVVPDGTELRIRRTG